MAIRNDKLKRDFSGYTKDETAAALQRALQEKFGFGIETNYNLEIINILIQNGKEIFKRTPSETLGGLSEGGRRHVQASFVARGSNLTDSENPEGFFREWDQIERDLEAWAREEGCWIADADNAMIRQYGDKIGNGTEANVYYDGKDVIKTIGSPFNQQEMLDRITLNNFLFPETALELVGLGRREDGEFCFIVRQPFIQGEYVHEKTVHMDILEDFREDPDGVENCFVNDYYILGDLHDRNILRSPEGNLFVIDCNVFLNTSERKGGKWIIPDVEFSDESLQEAYGKLNELLPKTASKGKIYGLVDSLYPDFSKTMENLGFYPYPVSLPMKNGTIQSFVFQVDPKNTSRLFYNTSEKIETIAKYDRRFDKEQLEKLSSGHVLKIGTTEYRFDLYKGRITEMNQLSKRMTLKDSMQVEIPKEKRKTVQKFNFFT